MNRRIMVHADLQPHAGEYAINKESRYVLFTYHRQPTYEEWQALLARAFADPDFEPGMSVISDRRQLEDTHTTDALRRMVTFLRTIPAIHGALWAIVSNPGSLAELGMTNMGQVLFEDSLKVTIRRFTELDAAIRWVSARS